jgi:predicted nucleotidyltransferase
MTAAVLEELRVETIDALRTAGARFALLHGSRVTGTHRPDSDVDVAAWWAGEAPPAFEVDLPAGVDLLVLNDVPLELAGRIALDGVLLYADELPRLRRSHREFVESVRRGR